MTTVWEIGPLLAQIASLDQAIEDARRAQASLQKQREAAISALAIAYASGVLAAPEEVQERVTRHLREAKDGRYEPLGG